MDMDSNPHPPNWLGKRPLLTWTLVFVYASLIFILSSMPHPPQIEGDDFTIKWVTTVGHILEYSILGFLLLAGFRSGDDRMRERAILLAIAIATLYGVTDEIHQSFVPNRDSSILDVLADGIGSTLGVFIGNLRRLE